MSPAKFNGEGIEDRKPINGSRPCPLRINKDSRAVQKPISFPDSRPPFSSAKELNDTAEHHQKKQQQRRPVIIYAHSPKVIHTKPRDFMALVQKLTGLSPPAEEDASGEGAQQEKNETRPFKVEGNGNIDHPSSPSSFSPPVPNQLFSDAPLYTPNSANFFFSPQTLYRFVDRVSPSRNLGNSTPPSVFEARNGTSSIYIEKMR